MSASEERLLSLEDVAERLQVSDQSVRRWIKAGKLAAYKPGLEWRIRPSDLEDFLETHSSPKVQAPLSSADQRRTPTPFERHAVEALEDRCSHLEAVLETAQRRSIPLEIWKLESDYALDIAMLSLPLFEREYLRPLVRPVGARFTELVYAMLDGMKDAGSIEEAERRREAIRPLEEAVA